MRTQRLRGNNVKGDAVATGEKAIRRDTNLDQPSGLNQTPYALLKQSTKDLALFLDCDGTLLDIAPTPNAVRVPNGLVELLKRIDDGLGGALAILTGRQLLEIDALLASTEWIGAGVHGSEMRHRVGGDILQIADGLPPALVESVVRRMPALPGVVVEPKGSGLALHYRQAPHLKSALEGELRALIAPYADSLVLCPGRKLFEVVPAGHSKGTALLALAQQPPFAGRRPIMIGDDIGDLPAFTAARHLGGCGFRVAGEAFGYDEVDFSGPTDVYAWLAALADAVSEQ
ncbi:trehalose-phosphatase [Hyphomicrobium sulfonivorans]|uniref:trehalose-phosphatase n=1 Tax=Hyphomicrobium sulfonivorans TaxID=121290 RepID=UPI001570C3E2|nr:trehalose-phosphatase [Hyphomicrobium sulfonivorans]MBI1648389.1 trehalose-phosphatase [Hyphomicrobium sulfonivorans]NSL71075.1 trehalose-phosphatase [Hyphomicrobium sulfonivorans]